MRCSPSWRDRTWPASPIQQYTGASIHFAIQFARRIIVKLMHHCNQERLHATLGYMTPPFWHLGNRDEIQDERARRIAAEGPCPSSNDPPAAIYRGGLSIERLFFGSGILSKLM